MVQTMKANNNGCKTLLCLYVLCGIHDVLLQVIFLFFMLATEGTHTHTHTQSFSEMSTGG